jgi:beta-glucosidase
MTLEQKFIRLDHHFGPPPQGALDVPSVTGDDGPNGIAKGPFPGPPQPSAVGVTAFPNQIVLGASWNRELAGEFGKAMAEEWRGKGMAEILGPTLNLMRTWHWGRSAETYGEDPYLIGAMASAEVKGIQDQHVISMLKHFSANNQDWDRVGHYPDYTGINEIISERALHEIFFPGFKTTVEKSSPGEVMCSYNQVNGVFACNNKELQSNLRRWGFQGAIVPDAVFAQHDPVKALHAGVDLLGGVPMKSLLEKGAITEADIDLALYHTLLPMFRQGVFDDVPTGNVKATVSTPAHLALSDRIIQEGSVLLKNDGHLLPLTPDKVKTIALIGAAAGPLAIVGEEGPAIYVDKISVPAEAIVARAGSEMHVTWVDAGAGIRPLPILKGDALTSSTGEKGSLTGSYFKSGDRSGAPAATRLDAAVDFNSLPAPELGKQVMSFAAPTMTWSARWTGTLTPPATGLYVFSLFGSGSAHLVIDGKTIVSLERVNFSGTALGALQLNAGKPVSLVLEHSNNYAVLGSSIHLGWFQPQPERMEAALKAAQISDVVIVYAGEQIGEGWDKQSLNLPGDQDALIEAVAAHNPRTIVVLNTSTPVAMPWIDKVASVLETWYPGQETGKATASLLFGDADPGGRLPMTFPVSADQGPATSREDYPGIEGVAKYSEGILVGYRWYDAHQQKPLFPFGFGLSYTQFAFSGLKVDREGDNVKVALTVTNTGARAGSDVVEVYVGEPAEATEPPSQLKGFEKVSLQPGEHKAVTIAIPLDTLATWNEKKHGWRLVPGLYEFKVGESSRNLGLTGKLEIKAAKN